MAKKNEDNRPRLSREEVLERKVNMAKERGSRVIKINSPMGSIMYNVLRQFDQAYNQFKGQLGEPGGISYEEGAELMAKVREITIDFSDLTKELSLQLGFRYFTPEELREVQRPQVRPQVQENKKTETQTSSI